jgi:ABC-2 type transport system ATP-binding protein
LTKRYGDTVAVEGLSLTVERGEVHGLLGPNGSGKTTALACALGLLRPSGGDAEVLGVPSPEIHRTGGRVGVVFDAAGLVAGLTVRQNLVYAQRLLGHHGGRGPEEVLRLVGVDGLAARRIGALSLGQAKRVSVARALLGAPELLVLDEPLSALDTLGVRTMLALVRRLADEGVTLLLASHRLRDVEEVLTHVSILSRGRLLAHGALEELRGGGDEHLRLHVAPLADAERLLEGIEGVQVVEVVATTAGEEASTLRLRLHGVTAGEVNRALVEAGCTVSAVVPERRDLHALFEEHVGRDDREATG